MSFHTGQTFTFGEQPSATKWQYLWDNDYALADGSGIEDDAIVARHVADNSVGSAQLFGLDKSNLTTDSNPYKFSAYRNAAWTTSNSGAVVQYDTELFDTNSNFDSTSNKGRYTAPVAGFYFFHAGYLDSSSTNTIRYALLRKNGSGAEVTGDVSTTGTANNLMTVSGLLQLSAGDYVEVLNVAGNASSGGTGKNNTYFHGFLVCRT